MSRLLCLVFLGVVVRGELPPPPPAEGEACVMEDAHKFDCYPEPGPTEEGCRGRGCCWTGGLTPRLPVPGVPLCFFPSNFGGYRFVNSSDTPRGQLAFFERNFRSPFAGDVALVRMDVEYQTDNRVRVKISDADNSRFEPPYPKLSTSNSTASDARYAVEFVNNSTGFRIKRNSGEILFDSVDLGGFTFADQFLQISSRYQGLMFGLGEHRSTLWLEPDWSRYTIFNNGPSPRENTNLYGSHPFYMVVDDAGLSHGVFLHNSNAMDVLLQPMPAVTFRTIGGVLDFYFFMGPTPADVVSQYTELVGRPFMPPYWTLGFHLCRYGYGSANETRAAWERNRQALIPFDTQWNDIDMMVTQNDFTVDPDRYGEVFDLVDEIHAAGMHYVVILDPGVSASEPAGTYPPYDDGVELDVFVKDQNDSIFIGKVWNPVSTAFVDFTHPAALEYWTKQSRDLHDKLPFDGLWIATFKMLLVPVDPLQRIVDPNFLVTPTFPVDPWGCTWTTLGTNADMNEPSNFLDGTANGCPDSDLERPQYYTGVDGDTLSHQTLCMTARLHAGLHYNVHNIYSIAQAEVTNLAVRDIVKKRPFVLSRSTFAGSGKYTAHWSGDNWSNWYDLKKSVFEILSFSLYGMSLTGADICGHVGEATAALCNRWMQLGAFYPFSRNHNQLGTPPQDPAFYGGVVVESSRHALSTRYRLLPYLYTLMYRAHVYGETVARPLFFEFTADHNTHRVDTAFLWGPALYIIPVTEENATSVTNYLPAGKWYTARTTEPVLSTGQEVTFDAPENEIPLMVRGGHVLPTQRPALTTTESRKTPFTFFAALDEAGNAQGSLFWDDGDTADTIENNQFGLLEFRVTDGSFTSSVVQWNTADTPTVEAVDVLGVKGPVAEVLVNGEPAEFSVSQTMALFVRGISIPGNQPIVMTWTYQ